MQIWYELQQAGEAGLSFDELVEKVKPRVPQGYAWRRYIRQRKNSGRIANAPTILPDTPGARAAAVHFVVRSSAQNMVRDGTALRRPDKRYAVGPRKPRSVFTDEQHDFDGSVSRKHVADMQLMRVLVEGGVIKAMQARRQHEGRVHLPAISQALGAALERWVEAHTPPGRSNTP